MGLYNIEILHHNDGKGNHESHTVTIKEMELSGGGTVTFPAGYGASLSAARKDFNEKLDEFLLVDVATLYASIHSVNKKPKTIEVDCFWKPINK